jgi:hypothetical protein
VLEIFLSPAIFEKDKWQECERNAASSTHYLYCSRSLQEEV